MTNLYSDPLDNPKAHHAVFHSDPVWGDDAIPDAVCVRCGEPVEAHDLTELPVDQVLRALGAPLLPGL